MKIIAEKGVTFCSPEGEPLEHFIRRTTALGTEVAKRTGGPYFIRQAGCGWEIYRNEIDAEVHSRQAEEKEKAEYQRLHAKYGPKQRDLVNPEYWEQERKRVSESVPHQEAVAKVEAAEAKQKAKAETIRQDGCLQIDRDEAVASNIKDLREMPRPGNTVLYHDGFDDVRAIGHLAGKAGFSGEKAVDECKFCGPPPCDRDCPHRTDP